MFNKVPKKGKNERELQFICSDVHFPFITSSPLAYGGSIYIYIYIMIISIMDVFKEKYNGE